MYDTFRYLFFDDMFHSTFKHLVKDTMSYVSFLMSFRACFIYVFKHIFSVFKYYYTYFYTLFYQHIFLKNTNNVTKTILPNRLLVSLIPIGKVIMLLITPSVPLCLSSIPFWDVPKYCPISKNKSH